MDTCDAKETEKEKEDPKKTKTVQETRTILTLHLAELNKRKTVYQGYTQELEQTGEPQKSLTDPESRLMMMANGKTDVCYNIQTAVDAKNKLIADFEVTNDVQDRNKLYVMAKKAAGILDVTELSAVADAGYDSATDIVDCIEHGLDVHVAGAEFDVCVPCSKDESKEVLSYTNGRCVYIAECNLALCPMGKVLYPSSYVKKTKGVSFYNSKACGSCVCRCSKGVKVFSIVMWEGEFSRVYDESGLFVRQVRVKPDKGFVRLRKSLSEHPFGALKRVMGMDYCLLKGVERVRGEFSLAFLVFNLKRVINMVGVPNLIQAIQA